MRYLLIILLSLCAGCILTLPALSVYLLLSIAGVLASAGLLLIVFTRKQELRLELVLLLTAAGILYGCGYRQLVVSPAHALVGQTNVCSCTVLDYPRENNYGFSVETKLSCGSKPVRATVYLYQDVEYLKPGDIFTAELTLSDSADDNSWYSYADGIYLRASGSAILSYAPCEHIPFRFWPRRVAHALALSLESSFPVDTVGYAVALTTGNRTMLPDSRKSILQRAGIYHALALSGMHMSVLVGALAFLGRKKRLKALIGFPLCIGFAIITGLTPSIVRAAVMQCLLLLAPACKRETDAPTSLSLAAAVLILQNPWSVMSWGLQLSFASVIGLCLFSRKLWLKLAPSKHVRFHRLRDFLAGSFSATFSALILTVPLMALDFGYISLISPLTNLLCGWVVSLCFAGSLTCALLGIFLPILAAPIAWITAWGFRYIEWISSALQRIPYACIYTDNIYFLLWLVLLYIILFLLLLRPDSGRIIPRCGLISTFSFCMIFTLLEGMPASFTAIDVGQGQSLLFRNNSGTVMVDCGNTKGDAGEIAADFLASLGEPDLDLLIVTHYDSDHINGIADLIQRTTIHGLILPDTNSEARAELEAAAFSAGIPVYSVQKDTTVWIGKEQISILAPVSNSSSNDASLAVLSRITGLSVLITGDMDTQAEILLLGTHELPDVDILVVGHHGSSTSTSEALLDKVTPELAVISVGKSNPYGHPTDETLNRLIAAGISVLRTDQQGSITLRPS